MNDSLEAHLRQQIDRSDRFFWHRLRWSLVRDYLPVGRPFELIDIGAGAGLVGNFLTREFPEATYRYIEPIESLRLHLGERFGDEADASSWPDYRSGQFVTMLDVLEHISDDHTFITKVVTSMAPGAVLLLTVPAQPRLWSSWDDALGHERRYDRTSLSACLDGLPLTILEMNFLFPELVPLAMVRSRLRRPSRAPTTSQDSSFPRLPGVVNDLLYGLGSLPLAWRSHWRTGTSLFLAATVTT
jgi:hypothetical protein